MTRRLLITSGCSFSVHEKDKLPYLKDGIVAWPKIVSYELDMDLINLSEPGASNSFIENTITDAIAKYKHLNPVIMVLWSQPHRVNINDCFVDSAFDLDNYKHTSCRPITSDEYSYTLTKSSLRSMWRCKNLAEQYNINYVHHIGCWRLKETRITNDKDDEIYKKIQNDWYFKNLDFSMPEIVWGISKWLKSVPNDGHPNQWSHHKLAEMFINKYSN